MIDLIAIGALLIIGSYAHSWYRSALARQTAQDAPALAQYTMGHRHSLAALAAPYDESKAAAWQARQDRQAAYRRGKSRKAQQQIKPATAGPIRRVK